MAGLKSIAVFLLQSVVVGLAVAFIVVLVRPDLMPAVTTDDRPASFADAVDLSSASVANIYTKRLVQDAGTEPSRARFRVETSFASAVIIDPDGYLVTNYHVVATAAEIRVQLSDGRITEPVTVGVDAETDLALLKVDLGDLPAIHIGRSDNLRIGDVVLAIGNPYGLTTSVTQGIVSATGRGLLNLVTFENFIQTDAAINAGNSGGALINYRGEVIGINTRNLGQAQGAQNIGFAIPITMARDVMQQIVENGSVRRGWLGALLSDMSPSLQTDGSSVRRGIQVRDVNHGGPAWSAGIRSGDILLSIDGVAVVDARALMLMISQRQPGGKIELQVHRDGEVFETYATLIQQPPLRRRL